MTQERGKDVIPTSGSPLETRTYPVTPEDVAQYTRPWVAAGWSVQQIKRDGRLTMVTYLKASR